MLTARIYCLCLFLGFERPVFGQNGMNATTVIGPGPVDAGKFSSQNYPKAYLPNTAHRWIIRTDSNKIIRLQFNPTFSLESAWFSSKCYDYINVQDGLKLTKMGKRCTNKLSAKNYCGQVPPPDFVSSSNSVVIDFCSDSTIQFDGFEVRWTAEMPPSTTAPAPVTALPSMCGLQWSQHPSDIHLFPNGSVAPMNYQSRIIGGRKAPSHSWPWVVALKRKSAYGDYLYQYCGGTLISNQWVVTAAHCCYGIEANSIQVRIGVDNDETANPDQPDCAVARVLTPPDYDYFKNSHDIALLLLNCTINFSDKIQPICLPTDTDFTYNGENFVVVGWGLTSKSKGSSSTDLMEVVVKKVDHETCKIDYEKTDILIDDTMICAAAPGKDACQGDSGGPLMSHKADHWYLSGIVSWGKNCALADYPGVYTKVLMFRNWILNNVKASL